MSRLIRENSRLFFTAPITLALLSAACSGPDANDQDPTATITQELVVVDGLTAQYAAFEAEFITLGRDDVFDIGLAPIPAFGSESLGVVSLDLDFVDDGAVYSGDFSVARGQDFTVPGDIALDLYAARNVPGFGRSAAPEAGDAFFLLGTIAPGGESFDAEDVNLRDTGTIDMLVAVREGTSPAAGSVAIGALTLFEKRFLAKKLGWTLPVPAGVSNAAVPTKDPFVQRGFQVFFNETFDGNGRTCGTCHRAENNFTIDEAFIKSLPASDPLFQAALTVPGLEGIDPSKPLAQIKEKGLILENVDGLNQTPVFRAVQHTLGMNATTTRQSFPILNGQVVKSPPDERTGWSGDGSPGRGTIHDFAVGAIVQHLTTDVAREPGVDFRLPTQEELDVLEAFQLSLGRPDDVQVGPLTFSQAGAQTGKQLFNTQGLCFVCHNNAGARASGPAIFNNVNLNQGVENRPETAALNLPPDGGFGLEEFFDLDGSSLGFGDGEFNVQSLIEAADTAPFFHNNSARTLEDAVRHYTTAAFEPGPAGFSEETRPTLNEAQVKDVAAFLRVLNAAQNIADVKKRLAFAADNSGPNHTQQLKIALADTIDALEVLSQPGRDLAGSGRHHLLTIKQIIEMAIPQAPAGQSAYAGVALIWCDLAIGTFFTQNPNREFLDN